jgi:hypothetical protein
MKFSSKRVLGTLTIGVLITGLGITAASAVDDSKEVRQGDFIAGLADTRSAGHVDFLEEGLHVWTDDASSNAKAAQYYAPKTGAFPTSASQDWYGTDAEPGKQLVFDYDQTDGNGNDYNILVGEPVYGDDWWLTNGSSADAKAADPSGADDGGSGSAYFGTLEEWKAAMPNARVLAVGFSLGSGVKGDGVIRAQTFGGQEYIFTDEVNAVTPVQPTVNPAGSTARVVSNRTVRYQVKTAAIPAGSKAGTLPEFRAKVNDATRFIARPAPGTSSYFYYTCPRTSRCVAKVFKNGAEVTSQRVTFRKVA